MRHLVRQRDAAIADVVATIIARVRAADLSGVSVSMSGDQQGEWAQLSA
jgi:hypothetical protein